jgi:sugar/nucleoside kinase (ribokinase family)
VDADRLDIVGVGNAIVDVLARADDRFLAEHGLEKGSMSLVDEAGAERIYAAMGPAVERSGGSCANSMAGAAALGSRVAYVGRVRDDELGEIFTHDIRAAGVRFETPPARDGLSTARSFVIVTPDAQRTMSTYLGASTELGPEDIDPGLFSSAAITYLEGYLWDPPRAKAAFRAAMEAARAGGGRVALSLSDPFCVDRHRAEFRELVAGPVDVLFANEREIISLYECDRFEEAVERVRGPGVLAVLTRSERGSVVVTGEETIAVPAEPVAAVVDTTGAGDLYAAGFLHGLVAGDDLERCARIGAIAAAEVISHVGARPEADLAALVAARLG